MRNSITDIDQLSIGGLYEMAVNDWRARVPWFEYSENLIKAILVGCFYGLNILFPQKKWLTFQRRRDILNIRKEKNNGNTVQL